MENLDPVVIVVSCILIWIGLNWLNSKWFISPRDPYEEYTDEELRKEMDREDAE